VVAANNQTVAAGQSVSLSNIFSVSGSGITQYQLWFSWPEAGEPAIGAFGANTGTLKLDNPASFAGTVAGMTGQDTIDFADIDPTKVQSPSYSGTAAGGTLTVTDGTHTANIALLGNYLASTFVASSDGHGGTSVTDPPLSASHPLSLAPSHS
jgi:hypothetical protein